MGLPDSFLRSIFPYVLYQFAQNRPKSDISISIHYITLKAFAMVLGGGEQCIRIPPSNFLLFWTNRQTRKCINWLEEGERRGAFIEELTWLQATLSCYLSGVFPPCCNVQDAVAVGEQRMSWIVAFFYLTTVCSLLCDTECFNSCTLKQKLFVI